MKNIELLRRAVYLGGRTARRAFLKLQWKFKHPRSKLFFPRKGFYFSQAGQDGLVYENFFKNTQGVFVDIGANHPIKLSNTYYFEKKGWHGYAFDPITDMNELWKQERPKTKLTNIAIGDGEKTVKFKQHVNIDGWGNMLSSIVNSDEDSEATNVRCLPLTQAIETRCIDFISIDVEGYEMNVLNGIDFDKIKPKVIVLENNSKGFVRWGDPKPRNFFKNKGYILWARIFGLDDIYVKIEK